MSLRVLFKRFIKLRPRVVKLRTMKYRAGGMVTMVHRRSLSFTKDSNYLKSMAMIGDAEADTILGKSGPLDYKVMFHLMHLKNNEPLVNDEGNGVILSSDILDYYNKPIEFPSWYDEERVIRGQKFANKHYLEICMSLLYYSLPYTYAFRGAKTLVLSEKLQNGVNSRSTRTMQFVKDVFQVGSFMIDKNNYGIRSMQTLRLIHSDSRIKFEKDILKHNKTLPINQLEQFCTIYGPFCFLLLEGIAKLNANYNDNELADFVYLWTVIGYFIGIDKSLLLNVEKDIDNIDRLKEIQKQFANWVIEESGQYSVSQDTKILSKSLLQYQRDLIPGELADDMVYSFWRYFLGDDYCDAIELPQSTKIGDKMLTSQQKYFQALDQLTDEKQRAKSLLLKTRQTLIDTWFQHLAKQSRIPFYFDPSKPQP